MEFGKVLVTGGAGFLGSQLVKKLLPISEHIYIIDDLSTGNRNSIPKSEKITFYHESITNEELLEKILPEVEWVYHLACRNILLSVVDMKEDFQTNLVGGYLLLQKAKTHGSKLKRFIYTSTASVYGNASILPTPESHYEITLPYSASKFSMEHYCQVYYHMYKLPVTILRLSNVYGPGQLLSNPYCGVVAKFFDAAQKGDPIPIYGDGTQTRDFTFIEDTMDALLLAGQHADGIGQIYNVGTGIETNINQLAKMIIHITDSKADQIQYQPKRIIDKVYRRSLNINKIQEGLQWSPRFNLYNGLQKTYEWLKEE